MRDTEFTYGNMKNSVFPVLTSCTLTDNYQRVLGMSCFNRQSGRVYILIYIYIYIYIYNIFFLHLLMKMEPIESSETSAFKTRTPGKNPKENIIHTYPSVGISRRFVRNVYIHLANHLKFHSRLFYSRLLKIFQFTLLINLHNILIN
jgi:hypothetical protein